MNISVVVRALNEEQHIGRLLSGIERQTRPVDEIVVVDSGSSDATVDIATHFGCRIVHIAPEDFSFGRSLNLGMERADGDILVVTSAHVYPLRTTWIENLVEVFDDERVGISYGRQVGGGSTKYSERRVMEHWFPSSSTTAQGNPFCNNANAAVRRRVWEQYRYNEFLTGLEDLDLAVRVQRDGWNLAYVAEAEIAHIHEESWSQIRNRYRREAIAHREIFHDQAMPVLEAIRLTAANVMSDLWSAEKERSLSDNAWDILLFRLNQFLGSFQGFRHAGPVTDELKRRFYYPNRGSPLESPDHEHGDLIDYSNLERPDASDDRYLDSN